MTKIKDPKVNKIIKKIAENYKPEAIYVFGSYAWGKPTKDSDLDLFIVKDSKDDFFQRSFKVRKSLGDYYPMAMDIFVFTNNETNQALKKDNIFIKKIICNGLKTYER